MTRKSRNVASGPAHASPTVQGTQPSYLPEKEPLELSQPLVLSQQPLFFET